MVTTQCGVELVKLSWSLAQSELSIAISLAALLALSLSLSHSLSFSLSLSLSLSLSPPPPPPPPHRTFEPVYSLLVAARVNKMKSGCHGVWVTFRSSTIIALYDSFVFLKLMEVDYTSLCPSLTFACDADVSYMYMYCRWILCTCAQVLCTP